MIIVGPNGVGKSALLSEVARGIGRGDLVETFFGSRQIQFKDEEVDQVGPRFEDISITG